MNMDILAQANEIIQKARRIIAFTGAGISVESGIPPFRGPGGIWSQYDSNCLDIQYFKKHPEKSWEIIKEIFYDHFGQAQPNLAHLALAKLEAIGKLHAVITQNIDNLHYLAGSKNIIEYHGSSRTLVCLKCNASFQRENCLLDSLPPRCTHCQGILKPDFVFFGESIPPDAQQKAYQETFQADVWLIIGTTGEVYPASSLPVEASRNKKTIIEINVSPSLYTDNITNLFLQGKATEIFSALMETMKIEIL